MSDVGSGPSNPQPKRQTDNPVRNSWESEFWDQFIGEVLAGPFSLDVKCSAACRLHIMGMAQLSVAATLQLTVDTVLLSPGSVVGGAWTGTIIGFSDVGIGTHTVALQATAGFLSNTLLIIRRGKMPRV